MIPHSERLLSLPPHGRPMHLYLHLGTDRTDRIDVTLTRPTAATLVRHVRACVAAMAD